MLKMRPRMKRTLVFFILIFVAISIYFYFFNPQKSGFETGEKEWHNYIDRFYYINLDSREDRKTEFLEEMRRMGVPSEKITRISAVNKPGQGDWGCSLSHLNTIKKFIEADLDTCIIFEDDFVFTQDLKTINAAFREVFEGEPRSFDIIMLSANEMHTEDFGHPYLKKVKDAQTASGYMVHKPFAPVLLQNFQESAKRIEKSYESGKSDVLQGPYCVDQYWKRLQPQSNWFVFSPKLGLQRVSYSDIQGGVINSGV